MFERIRRLWAQDSGATAFEYAVLASLVAVVVAGTVAVVGESVKALFDAAAAF